MPNGFELTPDLLLQGIAGLLIFFWALKDAWPLYRATKNKTPVDPMVAAVSMAWDRDMQERLLQIMERMAAAQEAQAKNQTAMAQTWGSMEDRQRIEMNERIDELLKALERKEQQLSDTLRSVLPSIGRPRRHRRSRQAG